GCLAVLVPGPSLAELLAGLGHVAGAGVPGVAQREPGDTLLRRDDRTVGGIGVGIVDGDAGDIVDAKAPGALDDDLILIGLVKMRVDDRSRLLLHEERHRIQAIAGGNRIAFLQRVAVLADEGGVPAIGGLAAVRAVSDGAVGCEDHVRTSSVAVTLTV